MLQIIHSAFRHSISIIQIAIFVIGLIFRRIFLDHPASFLKSRLRTSPTSTTGDHEAQAQESTISPASNDSKAEENIQNPEPTSPTPIKNSNEDESDSPSRARVEAEAEDAFYLAFLKTLPKSRRGRYKLPVPPKETIPEIDENLFQVYEPNNARHISPSKRFRSPIRFASAAGPADCISQSSAPSPSAAASAAAAAPIEYKPHDTSILLPPPAPTSFVKPPPSFWTPAPPVLVTITAPKSKRQRRKRNTLDKLFTTAVTMGEDDAIARPNLNKNKEASRFSGPPLALQVLDMNRGK